MENYQSDGRQRASIHVGGEVRIVEKKNQRTGVLTRGYVLKILTKSPTHPHGIKVMLETGEIGRVKELIPEFRE